MAQRNPQRSRCDATDRVGCAEFARPPFTNSSKPITKPSEVHGKSASNDTTASGGVLRHRRHEVSRLWTFRIRLRPSRLPEVSLRVPRPSFLQRPRALPVVWGEACHHLLRAAPEPDPRRRRPCPMGLFHHRKPWIDPAGKSIEKTGPLAMAEALNESLGELEIVHLKQGVFRNAGSRRRAGRAVSRATHDH